MKALKQGKTGDASAFGRFGKFARTITGAAPIATPAKADLPHI
ncbi:hypothetical protein [Tardiphaga sp.]|nr:hypothetical protein [Tardiphaga sp.]